jgi:hypothetical protein
MPPGLGPNVFLQRFQPAAEPLAACQGCKVMAPAGHNIWPKRQLARVTTCSSHGFSLLPKHLLLRKGATSGLSRSHSCGTGVSLLGSLFLPKHVQYCLSRVQSTGILRPHCSASRDQTVSGLQSRPFTACRCSLLPKHVLVVKVQGLSFLPKHLLLARGAKCSLSKSRHAATTPAGLGWTLCCPRPLPAAETPAASQPCNVQHLEVTPLC